MFIQTSAFAWALREACTFAFFDQTKPTEIYTDASPVGVSAVLAQEERIKFGSRALSSVEQRYSQKEGEPLKFYQVETYSFNNLMYIT